MNIQDFTTYCNNKGLKPLKYEVLHDFVEKVEMGEIAKCDCCGQVNDCNDLVGARYDYEKLVCPDCERDGN